MQHIKKVLVGLSLAVTLGVTTVTPAVASPPTPEPTPTTSVGVRVPAKTTGFVWTEEAMRAAKPMDEPVYADQVQRTRVGTRALGPTPDQQTPFAQFVAPEPPTVSHKSIWGGPDNKKFIPASVGKLFSLKSDGSPWQCSASVVHSPSGMVVLTAAHCLFGVGHPDAVDNGLFTDIVFVPAYHDHIDDSVRGMTTVYPFGRWKVVDKSIDPHWTVSTQPQRDYDHAFLTVEPEPGTGAPMDKTLESLTGGNGMSLGAMPSESVQAMGYPVDMEHPIYTYSTYRQWGFSAQFPDAMRVVDKDLTGGASGGPWSVFLAGYGDYGNIVAVTSAGDKTTGTAYGAKITAKTRDLYNRHIDR